MKDRVCFLPFGSDRVVVKPIAKNSSESFNAICGPPPFLATRVATDTTATVCRPTRLQCVLAGLHHDCGHVYGYDAVGSYEELAVTCAGQGRDLLQPILDQQFTSVPRAATTAIVSAAGATQQRVVGHVPCTVVDCASPEEAVHILLNAYRSVSEREIGVGDHVMFYTVQKRPASADGTRRASHVYHSKIWTSALKRH
jgi:20S proteasome alpha/beta subunit